MADGAVVATYAKSHLVPFGEYVPFADSLPLVKIVQGQIDYSPGDGPTTIRLPGIPPVSPLICYEAIFPRAVVDRSDRPGWLVNITNDAWFGTSAGPYQHLAIARVRAIEEGLPLLRSANTGISAVVGPYGRILSHLEIGKRGVLDSRLPEPTAPTLYGRFGDTIVLGLIIGSLALSWLLRALSGGVSRRRQSTDG